ncbi:MAG TPA: peptidogalycan biosysnthesis protein [Rhodanobacteraceae bacterium]|nr:peptidogalycan biosysnthesis protein [Rhodanobacteraceae bacterium]
MADPALRVRFVETLDAVDAAAWDALRADANPFLSHAFLAGLERHGCIRADWGWQAQHALLYRDTALVAAAPLYRKENSRGEFVFDFAWARAWEAAGGQYYPKLLGAVPYSPVTGPRLLTGTGPDAAALKRPLVDAMVEATLAHGWSSAHVDFLPPDDHNAFDARWLPRFDWQFHWHNRGYRRFDDFLAALRHKKRKNIRHERQQAHAGLACTMQRGDTLNERDWQRVHALYCDTFARKGNLATLSLGFFQHLATSLGDGLQLALARQRGEIVAMALFLVGGACLYGRYWGSAIEQAGLHFELCYYQGIDYAIAHGLARFEPGAQGEHKLARGFLPCRTESRHYIVHAGFRTAVAAALRREQAALLDYRAELLAHSPYTDLPP